MEKEYCYDVTEYRLAKGVTQENWMVEDIQGLPSFVRWKYEDSLDVVVSNEDIYRNEEE